MNSKTLVESFCRLATFQGDSLTERIRKMEVQLASKGIESAKMCCADIKLADVMAAAESIKRLAGQINVVIHTAGIVLSLPEILEKNEVIEYLSLGAGNTGKAFDLETNLQIGEFKFIDWQGGSETIRQNSLFKAFYQLAECPKSKRKCLYVVEDKHPLKFLTGKRSIASVFSRHEKLRSELHDKYGNRFVTVRDYYEYQKKSVSIVALNKIVHSCAKHFVGHICRGQL